jgi:arabinose-5-phosphate isomerase
MSADPVTIRRGELAATALSLMEARRITAIVVTSPEGAIEGVLHLHDLWRTQLF